MFGEWQAQEPFIFCAAEVRGRCRIPKRRPKMRPAAKHITQRHAGRSGLASQPASLLKSQIPLDMCPSFLAMVLVALPLVAS